MQIDSGVLARFWAKVDKNGPRQPHMDTQCWLWTAGANRQGYGRISVDGSPQLAHRVSMAIAGAVVPDGVCALHRCDIPACVNSAHIFQGTRADNLADMTAKGRQQKADGHYNARLTSASVLEMRDMRRGGATYASIAAAYGVHLITARDAILGNTWASVA